MKTVCFAVVIKESKYTIYYSEDGMEPVPLLGQQTVNTAYMSPLFLEKSFMVHAITQPYHRHLSKMVVFSNVHKDNDWNTELFEKNGPKANQRFFDTLSEDVERRVPRFWGKDEEGKELYARHWFFSLPPGLSEIGRELFLITAGRYGEVIQDELFSSDSPEEFRSVAYKLLKIANRKRKVAECTDFSFVTDPSVIDNPDHGILHLKLETNTLSARMWYPGGSVQTTELSMGTNQLDKSILADQLPEYWMELYEQDPEIQRKLLEGCRNVRKAFVQSVEKLPYDFLEPEPAVFYISPDQKLVMDSERMNRCLYGKNEMSRQESNEAWGQKIRTFLKTLAEENRKFSSQKGSPLLIEAETEDAALILDIISDVFSESRIKAGTGEQMLEAIECFERQEQAEQLLREAYRDIVGGQVIAGIMCHGGWWTLVPQIRAACLEEYNKVMAKVAAGVSKKVAEEVTVAVAGWESGKILLRGSITKVVKEQLDVWWKQAIPGLIQDALEEWREDPHPRCYERIFESLPFLQEKDRFEIADEPVLDVLEKALETIFVSETSDISAKNAVYDWLDMLRSNYLDLHERSGSVKRWKMILLTQDLECRQDMQFHYMGYMGNNETARIRIDEMTDIVSAEADAEMERLILRIKKNAGCCKLPCR